MPNIFKQAQQVNDHPKRNNFDLSKKINASFKFGTLYPVYCQPVVPGDSFSIDTAFNLKAMPVVFPVQTKMRAHMHYYFVRNKNLWRNFENWISNLPNATQDLTPHPFISRPDSDFKNGSIHDFLGVPTSLASNSLIPILYKGYKDSNDKFTQEVFGFYSIANLTTVNYDLSTAEAFSSNKYAVVVLNGIGFYSVIEEESDYIDIYVKPYSVSSALLRNGGKVSFPYYANFFKQIGTLATTKGYLMVVSQKFSYDEENSIWTITQNKVLACRQLSDYNGVDLPFTDEDIARIDADDGMHFFAVAQSMSALVNDFDIDDTSTYSSQSNIPEILYQVPAGVLDYSVLGLDLYSSHLHINALPYRAYESIYNAYYRNTVVDPLKDDSDNVLYNKYVVNDGDGADTHEYKLFQRNYELDFLTSALPSPQQGVAPMVGVTALGDITIEDENGITTARTESDEAGFVTKVVLTSPAASNEHARTLMNLAASGFNINDFRNTNALQRFMETSIRKGYKYKDFIAGHFGVEPKYVELDMPEFIGGFSRDVTVSTVISNADTLEQDGAALGEYGGYAQAVGSSKHSVRHYCDDYGFIIGIMCVTPTPCYSQLLPKHMIAPDNFLDYYFAEFSNIGMQPITYKEVAPIQGYLQSLADPSKSLEDTFGYQRPNYDMVSAVDEVHGDFRGSLRNYVINRIFDARPELGHDFIAIRPEEVNNIFVDTDPRDDTFIGEIGFSVHAKRPVPRVVIPNLGR